MKGSFTIIYPVTWLRYTSLTPRNSSETHTGSAWPWGHAQPFLLLHNQPCPTWAARTPSTGSTSAPGCRERRMQLEKSAQGGSKMAEKHCSRVRHAAEGTSKNLPLPPGKEFSTLQEKKKRELFQSDRLHGKERKERECQSVYLFIKQGKTEGWHQRAKANLFKHNCVQSGAVQIILLF